MVDVWTPLPRPAVYVNTNGGTVVRVPKPFTTLTQSMSLLVLTVSVTSVPFFANAGVNADELMLAAAAGDAISIGPVITAAPITAVVSQYPTLLRVPRNRCALDRLETMSRPPAACRRGRLNRIVVSPLTSRRARRPSTARRIYA